MSPGTHRNKSAAVINLKKGDLPGFEHVGFAVLVEHLKEIPKWQLEM